MTILARNEVLLEGWVSSPPEASHENHGTKFFRFFLEIPRLSGQADRLPVLVCEEFLPKVAVGCSLRIRGQLRSFNNRTGIGNRLILTVYATEVESSESQPQNQIVLSGALCKPPVFRRTPLGRSICDLMLAVPRRYGRTDYLPVIAWGQLAVRASQLQVGDELVLEGRVQSRIYHKVIDNNIYERVAYEVSMMHLLEEMPTL